ncbi:MAG: XRE family transcriptional regulator [Paralcaligenes sp.]
MNPIQMRLKYLRRTKHLTIDQLAQAAELSKGYISKLERGVSSPTVSTLLKLAMALDVSVGKLLGEEGDEERICVVRKNERQYIPVQTEANGLSALEALASKRTIKLMEPFIVRPPMELSEPIEMSQHAGDEFLHVIRGKVEVKMDDRTITLSAGDSLYFDATTPHRTRSLGRNPAEMLLITAS